MPRKSIDLDVIHPKLVERLRLWGETIATLRRRQRITLRSLAERTDVTTQTLGRMERGDVTVRVASYLTVFLVLGVLEELVPMPDAALRDSRGLRRRVRIPADLFSDG